MRSFQLSTHCRSTGLLHRIVVRDNARWQRTHPTPESFSDVSVERERCLTQVVFAHSSALPNGYRRSVQRRLPPHVLLVNGGLAGAEKLYAARSDLQFQQWMPIIVILLEKRQVQCERQDGRGSIAEGMRFDVILIGTSCVRLTLMVYLNGAPSSRQMDGFSIQQSSSLSVLREGCHSIRP